jgi:hypothetical protein
MDLSEVQKFETEETAQQRMARLLRKAKKMGIKQCRGTWFDIDGSACAIAAAYCADGGQGPAYWIDPAWMSRIPTKLMQELMWWNDSTQLDFDQIAELVEFNLW